MDKSPQIKTRRLLLRPFTLADAPMVQQLAGHSDIAATTLNIPHPYEDGQAEKWIEISAERHRRGELVNFAVVLRKENLLIGAIGLTINKGNEYAEMGYWIGRPYWGQGYCSEAAREVLRFGFIELSLNRIYATHMTRNPASGRVMEKIGMKYEGCLREHARKWGQFEDLKVYGILRHEHELMPKE
jgi:ribosomal-protein-alanine N-acetyltransferase